MSEVKTLVTLVLGGMFDHRELGDIDIVYEAPACEELQRELVVDSDDVHVELVSRIALDAAQSELAALREELAEIKESLAYRGSLLNRTQLRAEAAEQRNATRDIESAAKVLASCMDYPWEHMPENGRALMRKHAKAVIDAALAQPTESGASE